MAGQIDPGAPILPDGSWISPTWGNLGEQIVLTINRASQNNVYEVDVRGGDNGPTTNLAKAPNYATNKVTWTPPVSWAQYAYSNSNSMYEFVDLNFTIRTYQKSGTTYKQIGGSYTFTLSAGVPTSVVPTLSDFTLSDSTGYLTKFGSYVATKSKLTAKVTASGIYGSTIKQYKLSIGSTYAVSSSSTVSMSSSQLNTSGTINVTATVTDTRNRNAQKTKQITVLSYNNPSLSGGKAYRFNTSTNKEDDESNTVRVNCVGSLTSLNSKNTATVKIEYRLKTGSTWTLANTSSQGVSWNYNVDIPNLDSNNQYAIRVTAIDAVNGQTSTEYEVSTATPVMDFLANGKGVAIGRVSTSDGFDVAMNATFEKNVSFYKSFAHHGGNYIEVNSSEGNGASGWVRICRMVNNRNWITSPMVFVVVQRNKHVSFIHVLYSGSETTNMVLSSAYVNGTANVKVDVSGNVSAIYVQKTEAWDEVGLLDVYMDPIYYANISFDYTPYFTSATPGGTLVGPNTHIYPVGSIVIRYDNTSPASLYGGSWTRLSGTFLYATGSGGTIGATGGSSTHTLTVAQMPSHTHGQLVSANPGTGNSKRLDYVADGNGYFYDQGISTYPTGGGQAHNNNPYFTNVAVWRRTA